MERWNGSKWSLQAAAISDGNELAVASELNGVSCTTATDCWAVGVGRFLSKVNGLETVQAVVERWEGGAWSFMETPNALDEATLYAVACHKSNSCTAVGYEIVAYLSSNVPAASILHWNGISWAAQASRTKNATVPRVSFDGEVLRRSDPVGVLATATSVESA
jgi:hypothetical protein